MTAYRCLDCDDLPGIDGGPLGPGAADAHEERGHDVRRLPERREQRGGPHGPPLRDPEGPEGDVAVWRGERTGRRRANY
jgi:hypothetical protein